MDALLGYMPCGCLVAVDLHPDPATRAEWAANGYAIKEVAREEAIAAWQAVNATLCVW